MKFQFGLVFGIFIFLSAINLCDGMFEAVMTQFEPMIRNSPIVNLDNLKIIRFNRTTHVLNGSFEILQNIADSIEDAVGMCNLYRKGGNEYKLLPYKMGPSKLCKVILDDEYFYSEFHKFTENFPPVKSCDFKSGITYYIKNFLPDLSKVPAVFPSGDYMISCEVHKDEELIQGYKFYGQLFNIASYG